MLLNEIIDIIESAAPLPLQESWDNSGLQIGHKDADVTTVLLCTDVTECVMQEAVAVGAQLIISHHPLLFHGLKTISGGTPQQRIAECAIRHGIAVYSSHTAMDVQPGGVSGYMAQLLGIDSYTILSPAGAETGLGVIGDMEEPLSLQAFLERLSSVFRQQCIRYSRGGAEHRPVRRVALVGGAGAEFIPDAIEQGADAFVSADIKHHDFTDYLGTIPVIDIGHFESEQHTKDIFRRLLTGQQGHPTGQPHAPLTILNAESDQSPTLWFVRN